MPKYSQLPRSVNVQSEKVGTMKQSSYISIYMKRMETMEQYGPWSSLGTHGYVVVTGYVFLVVVRPEKVKVNCFPYLGIFAKVFCSGGPNLVILAGTGDEL